MEPKKRLSAGKVRAVLKKHFPEKQSMKIKLSNWTDYTPGWQVNGDFKISFSDPDRRSPISIFWYVPLHIPEVVKDRDREVGLSKVLEILKSQGMIADARLTRLENVRWAE